MEWWQALVLVCVSILLITHLIFVPIDGLMQYHFTEIKKRSNFNRFGIILIQLLYLIIVPGYVICEMIYWVCHIKKQ